MSDLKDKIKAELDSQIWINEGDYSSIIDGKDDATNGIEIIAEQHAAERAVAFMYWATVTSRYELYRHNADVDWYHLDDPKRTPITHTELYALFVEETKNK